MFRWKSGVRAVVFILTSLVTSEAQAQRHTLTTGVGDASVTVDVDAFGDFGNRGNVSNGGNAMYDPVGVGGPASTTYESWVALRVGPVGPRAALTAPAPPIVGNTTACTSSFTIGNLDFTLVQTVAPMFLGPIQNGSLLTQTYTVTNTSLAPVNFELVRFFDGDLFFDGTLVDGGGRLPGPPETFFETDKGGTAATSTTFVGIQGTGGTAPPINRFELAAGNLRNKVFNGSALSDTIQNDSDADGFVDPGKEYDVHMALRNTFILAPGASTTYTATTIFGSGIPATPTYSVAVIESGGSTDVTEGGAIDTYSLALTAVPTTNVTITVNPDSQVTVSAPSVVFTPLNWNMPQTITVTAVDDIVYEGLHTGAITHAVVSADLAYNGIAVAGVVANITDDETPPPPPEGPGGNEEGTYGGSGGHGGGGEGAFGFGFSGGGMARYEPILKGPIADATGGLRVANVSYQKADDQTGTNTGGGFGLFGWSVVLVLGAGVILLIKKMGFV